MTNKGFTLIEIIVVLIILGVLAAMAMPAYFNWVERSRAAEAFSYMKSFKDLAETCAITRNSSNAEYNNCIVSIANSLPMPPHFILDISGGTGGVQTSWTDSATMTYQIRIIRNGPIEQNYILFDCGGGGTNAFYSGFYLCRDASGSTRTRSWGIYQGM